MSLLSKAFDLMPEPGGPRACSAADLSALLPQRPANPRQLTHTLLTRGLISVAFVDHGQTYFVRVPDAEPPIDARAARCDAANAKAHARAQAAEARAAARAQADQARAARLAKRGAK